MAQNGYVRKRRYKIKYKNLAILLAILLILILLIARGCSALFGKNKDKNKDLDNEPLVTGDSQQQNVPLENVPALDPATQYYYSFTYEDKTSADLGEGDLVLVNNNIQYLGSVNEDELSVVRELKNNAYSVKDYTVKVRPEAMNALNEMLLAFYTATGKDTIMVNAGYRTLEYQQELYDDDLASSGQNSSTLVAKPGYSEHHTGLAVDFTVYENGKYDQSKLGNGEYTWIDENAHKFGFVNRYPKGKETLTMIDNEPWHYRYVGVPHATVMKNYGYCLEEYIDFIKNYTIKNGFLSVNTDDGSQYMIYYVPMSGGDSTSVYVPATDKETGTKTYPYEISGNNVDGWIVTFLYKEGDGTAVPPAADEPDVTEPAEDSQTDGTETE